MVSNNVPSNLTKGSSSGVCSALIYGNFSDLLIGLFGDSEILVDPYSAMQTGVTAVRILQAIDVKVSGSNVYDIPEINNTKSIMKCNESELPKGVKIKY